MAKVDTAKRTDRSESGISIWEVAIVLCGVAVVGIALVFFLAEKTAEALELGLSKLASTLAETEMPETCQTRAGVPATCRMMGEYRIMKTADKAWTISWTDRKSAYGQMDIMSVTDGMTYMNSLLTMDENRQLKREIVKVVTGKSVSEFSTELESHH
ncbi:hypothetical protein G6L37_04730 [Agrobacterium rubi]|nr:hypothetical protein [Agrobacterium rubi]NTF24659.1 hypothetical protein [Agrobacterium rubi]